MAGEAQKPSQTKSQPPDWYISSRRKDASNTGALTFTLLRLLDLPWQYYLLSSGVGTSLLSRVGLSPISPPLPGSQTFLGLSPYHALILGLATGTSLSQSYWGLVVRDNYFPPSGATFVAAYNSLLNTLNSTLALWAVTSQAAGLSYDGLPTSWSIVLGVPLYLLGTYLERYSEIQRKAFKAQPANAGKPFAGGLYGLARNINYGGYTLMRTGYALVCGGWVWGAVMASMVAGDFAFRAIPWMEEYCESKYGEQWRQLKRKVPYRLLPWLY